MRHEEGHLVREMMKQAPLAHAGLRSHGVKRHMGRPGLQNDSLGGIDNSIILTRPRAHRNSPKENMVSGSRFKVQGKKSRICLCLNPKPETLNCF
jgi:hypothetical protein